MSGAANRFLKSLDEERPLQIVGTINAYSALLAEHSGFQAIYLSGAGVANASYGLPDVGITNLGDVLEDARRICAVTEVPLLVDIDTGFGHLLGISRTVREMERTGVAVVHIEDQVDTKRCGHRKGKQLVSKNEMIGRIKACVDARNEMLIMARTDALGVEGLQAAIDRAGAYVEAGADFLFAEAVSDKSIYRRFTELGRPVLANITEYGLTDLYTTEQLLTEGVRMVLYPLSAFRAMSKAALDVYSAIRAEGTQKNVVHKMQTRDELYAHLRYVESERWLDALYGEKIEEED